jgi:hypothetical protein
MRARLALVASAVVAFAACGAGSSTTPTPTTGLVLALHFDHANVASVSVSGAALSSARRFGPYVVAEEALPRDGTVGFVFDRGDEGAAMVCGEAHDTVGHVLASGCDTFDVRSDEITRGDLYLDAPSPF